jgi:hypothetical protein
MRANLSDDIGIGEVGAHDHRHGPMIQLGPFGQTVTSRINGQRRRRNTRWSPKSLFGCRSMPNQALSSGSPPDSGGKHEEETK